MTSIIKVNNIQNSSGNTAMTISGTGVVTPKTTSFVFAYAQGTSGYNTVTTGSYLPLTAVYQSKGSGSSDFNTTTYKYTAPVNGIYFITLAGITSASNVSGHFNLDINGTEQYVLTWTSSREYHSSVHQYLNAGEVVGFKSANTSGYYRHSDTLPSASHYTYCIFNLIQELT